jgi:hypothetical protein
LIRIDLLSFQRRHHTFPDILFSSSSFLLHLPFLPVLAALFFFLIILILCICFSSIHFFALLLSPLPSPLLYSPFLFSFQLSLDWIGLDWIGLAWID